MGLSVVPIKIDVIQHVIFMEGWTEKLRKRTLLCVKEKFMFLQLGSEYVNLDQLVRVEFSGVGHNQVATMYFAKPGGSDRHMISGSSVQILENALSNLTPMAMAASSSRCRKKVKPEESLEKMTEECKILSGIDS